MLIVLISGRESDGRRGWHARKFEKYIEDDELIMNESGQSIN